MLGEKKSILFNQLNQFQPAQKFSWVDNVTNNNSKKLIIYARRREKISPYSKYWYHGPH